MIVEKKAVLRPILESSGGIHLTAYLVNRGDLADLKSQLRAVLNDAEGWLQPAQTAEERRKFLLPLSGLLRDARIFRGMKGNIAMFRTKDSFRVLTVPVDLERQCHVASSFHVKPLLRWLQTDREFLFLGVSQEAAHLYLGNSTSVRRVDSIALPEFLTRTRVPKPGLSRKELGLLREREDETFAWLSDWLEQLTQTSSPRLFLAGDKKILSGLLKVLKYGPVMKRPIAPAYSEPALVEACETIRKLLMHQAKRRLESVLSEFRSAQELSLTKKNIFEIARASVQGRVKKLLVAEGINIFGKVDKKTGGLAIHLTDSDHEDDDILDDLAQAVLASGGEVVVVPKDQIPGKYPVLAILESRGTRADKRVSRSECEAFGEGASP